MSTVAEYERLAARVRQPGDDGSLPGLDLRECVRLGVLAASSHNTQPWRFRIEAARLWIQPDLERRCRVVDPDDAHLYKSLGCAAENIVHAAVAQGCNANVRYVALADRVEIDFELGAPSGVGGLVRAIPLRQCTRLPYARRQLSPEVLRRLEAAGQGDGVRTVLVTDHVRLESIVEFVASGNHTQLADPAFRRELITWIRFNPGSAIARRDGLAGRASGQPSLPDWLATRLTGLILSGRSQAATDARNIRSSAGVAITVAKQDNRTSWIAAGRVWERFALQATALDVRTAFINQPIEVPALRPQLAGWLGLQGETPLLMTRFGYGPLAPYSLRRPLDDVLDESSLPEHHASRPRQRDARGVSSRQ